MRFIDLSNSSFSTRTASLDTNVRCAAIDLAAQLGQISYIMAEVNDDGHQIGNGVGFIASVGNSYGGARA